MGSHTLIHIPSTFILVGRRLDSPIVDSGRDALFNTGLRLVSIRVGDRAMAELKYLIGSFYR